MMMKKYLTWIVFFLPTLFSTAQSIYRKDYVETFDSDWSGLWWTPAATANYYTNASVTPTSSAVLYGSGNGSSSYESDWYSFPNISVDPNYEYSFKFRLGSYRFTSASSTRGVDVGDYIIVQLSTDGGTTYNNEIRITGNNNAYWDYNSSGSYTKTADGIQNIISPSAGGDRTSTGDGYSSITLNIPLGVSNIAIDIFCRANASGEEWWLDNFELWETPIDPLPVEMISFYGYGIPSYNILEWSTASEMNSDYFLIEKSRYGESWDFLEIVEAAGNSNEVIKYKLADDNVYYSGIYYYRIKQYDIDGVFKPYGPIAVLNEVRIKKIVGYVDLLGRWVNPDSDGIIFEIYDDGEAKKIIR